MAGIARKVLSGLVPIYVEAALIGILFWVGFSHFEAEAYNRVTGANVTTWEAMFVSLRVQTAPAAERRGYEPSGQVER